MSGLVTAAAEDSSLYQWSPVPQGTEDVTRYLETALAWRDEARLDVNREQVVLDRRSGLSLTQVAKKHCISRASVCRMMKEGAENSMPAASATAIELAEHARAGQ